MCSNLPLLLYVKTYIILEFLDGVEENIYTENTTFIRPFVPTQYILLLPTRKCGHVYIARR